MEQDLIAAADAIASADAMVIGTGAGMGVDSGLGTFRGRNAGVWLPLKAMQIDFSQMSCPDVFEEDPYAAWAFWKFRHDAYTQSTPHDGYRLLAEWGAQMPKGFFSITSNIDGHWCRTVGEERTYEMHGALTHMQLLDKEGAIWPTDPADMSRLHVAPWDLTAGEVVEVLQQQGSCSDWRRAQWVSNPDIKVGDDGATIVAGSGDGVGGPLSGVRGVRRPGGGPDLCRVAPGTPLPTDPIGLPARPNVLMFGDGGFQRDRVATQQRRYRQWMSGVALDDRARLVVVEVGAGTAVPSIRYVCESLLSKYRGPVTLVRINLDQHRVPASRPGRACIGVGGMGALEALRKLDGLVRTRRRG